MPRIPKNPQDPLKHFSQDSASVRLTALFVTRAHLILSGTAALIYSVASAVRVFSA